MWMFAENCKTEVRLDGKTVVVTGATGGIGKEVVKDFYERGARVILACRNLDLGRKIISKLEKRNNSQKGELSLEYIELSSLESVKKCADNILKNESKINILINNGGIFVPNEKLTKDGFESNFGINYLATFLFTLLLLPKIIESKPSRIVNVSSICFIAISSIDFDDFNYEKPSNPYNDLMAYGQSKLFLIFFTRYLANKLKKKIINDVTTYSLHPGHVNSNLTRNYNQNSYLLHIIYGKIVSPLFLKTPKQGAQTIIHCAIDENTKTESGYFYRNCKVANLTKFASNEDLDREIWKRSIEILKKFFGDDFTVPTILED